jgi:undecaprenyl-diphosphatase
MFIMEELNHALFLVINAGPQSPPWLLQLAHFFAVELINLTPFILAALWLWGARDDRETALTVLLSVAIAACLNQVISLAYPHPRPFMIGLGHTFLAHAPESSFPSDHATVLFAFGFTLMQSRWFALGALTVLFGAAVGLARVYLGVHFPLDIAGSIPVGVIGAMLAGRLFQGTSWGRRVLGGMEDVYRRLFARPIASGWIRG